MTTVADATTHSLPRVAVESPTRTGMALSEVAVMDRTVVAYLSSYGLSMLGNSVAAVVLPLVVLQTTGAALGAGAVAAATAIPAVLAGVFMGGVIDRVHRRSASIVTDLVSAAAVAALPMVDLVGDLSVGWFVTFGIIGSFGDVPGLTAREALLPQITAQNIISADRLVGLRESLGAIVMLAGPAAAAGLVTAVDGATALWVTAALSLAAALTTFAIPREVGAVAATGGGVKTGKNPASVAIEQLREGWTFLFLRSRFLLTVTIVNLVLVSTLAALQGLLLPVHFTATGEQGQLGLVLSAMGVGLLLGSVALTALHARMTRRTWFVTGLVGSVAGIGVVANFPPVIWVFAGAVVLGLGGGVVSTLLGVLMNERIPDAMRGRVTGTQNAVLTGAPSVGVLGAAVLVDTKSLATAGVVVTAVWTAAVAGALLAPALRDLAPRTSYQ